MLSALLRITGVVGTILLCLTALPVCAGNEKAAEQAKAAAVQFIKAFEANRWDDLMKVVDVPWYENLQKHIVIKDRDELKKFLERMQKEAAKSPRKIRIRDVTSYAKARGMLEDVKIRKSFDAVLAKEDWLVRVTGGIGLLLVRVRDGKAKVVGVTD